MNYWHFLIISLLSFSCVAKQTEREIEDQLVKKYQPANLNSYGFTLPVDSKVPEVHQLTNNLQAAFFFYKDKDKFVKTADRIIELDPDYPTAYLMRAFYVQDPDEYKRWVEKAYQLSKKSQLKSEQYLVQAEYSLLVEEDYLKAQQYFKKVVDMYPDSPAAIWSLGMAYYYGGKLDQAMESYKKSTELIPNLPKGYEFMSVISYTKKNFAKALEYLEKAKKYGANAQHDIYFSEYENLVYYKNENYQKTLESIEEAFSYGPIYKNSERLQDLYKVTKEKVESQGKG